MGVDGSVRGKGVPRGEGGGEVGEKDAAVATALLGYGLSKEGSPELVRLELAEVPVSNRQTDRQTCQERVDIEVGGGVEVCGSGENLLCVKEIFVGLSCRCWECPAAVVDVLVDTVEETTFWLKQ